MVDVQAPSTVSAVGGVVTGEGAARGLLGALGTRCVPLHDVLGVPDLAHGEIGGRLWEIIAGHQLRDALPRDAEDAGDLGWAGVFVHMITLAITRRIDK